MTRLQRRVAVAGLAVLMTAGGVVGLAAHHGRPQASRLREIRAPITEARATTSTGEPTTTAATTTTSAPVTEPVTTRARPASAPPTTAPMGPWAYVINSGAVSAVSLSSHTVVRSAPADQVWGDVAVSPDRQRVAYAANGGLFLSDAGLANPKKVDASEWGLTLSWSPDGSRLVYAAGPETALELFVVQRDGSGRRQLTQDAHVRYEIPDGGKVALSPDGSRIAFISNLGSGQDVIEVADVASGQITQITQIGDGAFYYLAWLPDGHQLLAVNWRSDGIPHLVTLADDGSGLRRITASTDREDAATLSPDGTTVAFVSEPTTSGPNRLSVVHVDGSDRRDLTSGNPEVGGPTGGGPHWSADGNDILFIQLNAKDVYLGSVVSVPPAGGAPETVAAGRYGRCDW